VPSTLPSSRSNSLAPTRWGVEPDARTTVASAPRRRLLSKSSTAETMSRKEASSQNAQLETRRWHDSMATWPSASC
jgi:hypothetical protein